MKVDPSAGALLLAVRALAIEIATDHVADDTEESATTRLPPPPDRRIRVGLWQKHQRTMTFLPRQYDEMQHKVQLLLDNPILPSDCAALLTRYKEQVDHNVRGVKALLDDVKSQLPDKYPSLDLMQRATINWLRAAHIRRFKDLEPSAAEIIAYVRNYFGSDKLLK